MKKFKKKEKKKLKKQLKDKLKKELNQFKIQLIKLQKMEEVVEGVAVEGGEVAVAQEEVAPKKSKKRYD